MEQDKLSFQSEQLHFNNKAADFLNDLLNDYAQRIILCDKHTKKHCLPLLLKLVSRPASDFIIITVKAGEKSKSLKVIGRICSKLTEHQVTRNALFINLGGGVVGDLGGFAASVFKRGLRYVNVPTSLMAMIDASHGGKTAVNHQELKNIIGTFYPATAVLVISDFLKTLPSRELNAAFAEMIKHALISDEVYLNELEKGLTKNQLPDEKLIRKSIQIKQRIVKRDPFEKSVRKTLNFGHTFGHAYESLLMETNHALSHGEAVAAGILFETYLSGKMLGLNKSSMKRIEALLLRLFGNLFGVKIEPAKLVQIMLNDKKNRGAEVDFVLLSSIGKATINNSLKADSIQKLLEDFIAEKKMVSVKPSGKRA
jgi:3-dehydroquinate synthase